MSAGDAPGGAELAQKDAGSLPDYLTQTPRWVLWRRTQRIDRKTGVTTETKVPISYRTGRNCDITDPRTWAEYTACEQAVTRASGAYDGTGFVLGLIEERDEYVIALDLDACLDDAGDPEPWALPFLTAMPTYTEVSVSGTGLHPIARIRAVDLPAAQRLLEIPENDKDQARTRAFGERANGAQHVPGAQLFLMKRYFAITGHHWAMSPEEVRLLTLEQVTQLAGAFGPNDKRRAMPPTTHRAGNDDDDTEPDEAAVRDKLGAEFLRNPTLRYRWEGGTDGLSDTTRSGRDMSVLAMLVTAGFGKPEIRVALQQFEHGKMAHEGTRYFDRMWARTQATTRPERDPGYIADVEQQAREERERGAPQTQQPDPDALAACTHIWRAGRDAGKKGAYISDLPCTIIGDEQQHTDGTIWVPVRTWDGCNGFAPKDQLFTRQQIADMDRPATPEPAPEPEPPASEGLPDPEPGPAPPPNPEPPAGWEDAHPPSGAVAAASSAWPEPVDCFISPNADPVDVTEQESPPALWPFIGDTAGRMGVAASSVTLGTVVSCSAVISDDWRLQPKRFDYTWVENARPWGAIVGPPSILKTPVIVACTRPVDRLEQDAREQWQEDMRQWANAKAAAKDEGHDFTDPEPKRPRWLVESTTIEALQEVLRDDAGARFTAPARKVLVRQDELSEFLANLDRYSNGRQGGDRAAYLRLYNGGPFTVDRIGRGAFTASNWSGCLLGGIQPEPIQQIAKHTVDDGLLQRMIYDVPPSQAAPGADRKPDRDAIERYHRLIPALAALQPPRAPDGRIEAVVLHADAHTHRESIDDLARNMAALPDLSSRLQSTFGKWPGLFARLCLTFHLIEIADAKAAGNLGPPVDVVQPATAERVARYMRRVLLPHLLRAEALMFATVQTGHCKWIAGHILAHQLDRITLRDVVRAYIPLRVPEARDELHSVMAGLVNIGWLDPEPPRNPLNPVSAWRVNPQVHDLFAGRAEQERLERQQRAQDMIKRRQDAAAQGGGVSHGQ